MFVKGTFMDTKSRILKRTLMLVAMLSVAVVTVAVVRTTGQEETKTSERTSDRNNDQWEYLAVAGPSTTNLTPTGNPRMRKEPNVPFGREAFVLEQHLDKLGANGWELVAVAGPPTDPAYYFKRRR
jgi:type II secretory pathway pseudopilin PulG